MVKVNQLAVVFWFFLLVAVAMVAAAIPEVGYVKVDKYFFGVLLILLLVIFGFSLFLVSYRDEGKIPIFSDLRKRNVFVKASASPEYKLTTIIDPETGESLIITGVPENLPNTFMIENDGKVRDLTK